MDAMQAVRLAVLALLERHGVCFSKPPKNRKLVKALVRVRKVAHPIDKAAEWDLLEDAARAGGYRMWGDYGTL